MTEARRELESLLAAMAVDARAGGAQTVLEHVALVRDLLADGVPAAELALAVVRMVQTLEATKHAAYLEDMTRGKKVLQAARDGAEARHGTPAERARQSADFQRTVNALHKSNPHLSWYQLAQRAASQHGCSYRTIQRRTTNPCASLDTALHCQK